MKKAKAVFSIQAFIEDHDYFRELQDKYKEDGFVAAALFADMIKAFKEKRGE